MTVSVCQRAYVKHEPAFGVDAHDSATRFRGDGPSRNALVAARAHADRTESDDELSPKAVRLRASGDANHGDETQPAGRRRDESTETQPQPFEVGFSRGARAHRPRGRIGRECAG